MTVLRRGETEDLDAVTAIQAASPEAAHWNAVEYLPHEFLVAVDESGSLAGFAVWRHLGAGEWELLNMAVALPFRRRGVARQLLSGLLEKADCDVFLEVRESNQAARMLYKSMGFQEVSIRKNYYAFPPEAAIVMKFHSC